MTKSNVLGQYILAFVLPWFPALLFELVVIVDVKVLDTTAGSFFVGFQAISLAAGGLINAFIYGLSVNTRSYLAVRFKEILARYRGYLPIRSSEEKNLSQEVLINSNREELTL